MVSTSLDQVASCVLYFSSVIMFWDVFCRLEGWACWQKSDRVSKYLFRR